MSKTKEETMQQWREALTESARTAVEALAARRDWAIAHLNPTNADGRAEAVALVEGYRAALLANPRLDADKAAALAAR